jgi:8-oxo-dGTP pyrophosphatase MutT (NUDIX family)
MTRTEKLLAELIALPSVNPAFILFSSVGPRCRAASDDQQVVPTTPALATAEHNDIRWCSAEELDKLQPPMLGAVKWYCRAAIREISSQT